MLSAARLISCFFMVLAPLWVQGAEQLRLVEEKSIQEHVPVLIAHRGGVVGPDLPENSVTALELAAANGYAMVEVDIRMTADEVPVAFLDAHLLEHAGIEGTMATSKLPYISPWERW
jgi:glycerophosphoryl diester phosphodiesterase